MMRSDGLPTLTVCLNGLDPNLFYFQAMGHLAQAFETLQLMAEASGICE